MAINTGASLEKVGYSIQDIPNMGQTKIPMYKLESEEEAKDKDGNPRERRWIECGPFRIEMIRSLRARGFRELPPERPSTGGESKAICDVCGFEAKNEFGLNAHKRKHTAERESKQE